MANYYGYTRTNYFKVDNEDTFLKLIDECGSDDSQGIEVWTHEEEGIKRYAFGCESDLLGLPVSNNAPGEEEEIVDYDYDEFIKELQQLLPDGEVAIITNIGKMKLCYLHGDIHIITNKQTVLKSLHTIGIETARKLLGNAEWDTKNEY